MVPTFPVSVSTSRATSAEDIGFLDKILKPVPSRTSSPFDSGYPVDREYAR
jgi:hypothetical protein